MGLTSRQKEIFNFVRTFIHERGYPPSVREIAGHFRIYPRAAFDHLKALEKKGYLRRKGSMSRSLELLVFEENETPRDIKEGRSFVREIPVIGRVAAGKPLLAVEHVEGTIPLPREWINGEEVFLLKVKGDSMAPYILPDDYVVVRSQPLAENGDVVVTLIGEEATVKRFFKRGEKIELKPNNEKWETIKIEERSTDIKILGKVIGVFRRL